MAAVREVGGFGGKGVDGGEVFFLKAGMLFEDFVFGHSVG